MQLLLISIYSLVTTCVILRKSEQYDYIVSLPINAINTITVVLMLSVYRVTCLMLKVALRWGLHLHFDICSLHPMPEGQNTNSIHACRNRFLIDRECEEGGKTSYLPVCLREIVHKLVRRAKCCHLETCKQK